MRHSNLSPEKTRVDQLVDLFTAFQNTPNKFKDTELKEKYDAERVSLEFLQRFNKILDAKFGHCAGGIDLIDAQIYLYKVLFNADNARDFCDKIRKDLSKHPDDYAENHTKDLDLGKRLDFDYIDSLEVEETSDSPIIIEEKYDDDDVLLSDTNDASSTPIGISDIDNDTIQESNNFCSVNTTPTSQEEYTFSLTKFDEVTVDFFKDTDLDEDQKIELAGIFKDESKFKGNEKTFLDEKYYHHYDKGKEITDDQKNSDEALDKLLAERLQLEECNNSLKK